MIQMPILKMKNLELNITNTAEDSGVLWISVPELSFSEAYDIFSLKENTENILVIDPIPETEVEFIGFTDLSQISTLPVTVTMIALRKPQ